MTKNNTEDMLHTMRYSAHQLRKTSRQIDNIHMLLMAFEDQMNKAIQEGSRTAWEDLSYMFSTAMVALSATAEELRTDSDSAAEDIALMTGGPAESNTERAAS